MTVIRPNSVSGITSITAQANEINFFRSNGTLAGLQLNGVNFNTTSGISTFAALEVTGNLDVNGVLTYQDVTNVDSIGIITARSDIKLTAAEGKIEATGATGLTLNASHSSAYARIRVAGSERLRITSAGNLALGNDGSFPIYAGANDRNFIIGTGSDDAAVHLHSGTTKFGGIYFGDATSGGDRYVGYVEYKHDDNYLRIATNGAEKLRINSAGALITNTTGTLIADFNSSNSAGSYLQFDMGASGANIGYMGSADQLISGAAIADLAIRSTQNFAISTGGASERFRISSTGQIICNTSQTVSAEFNTSSGAGSYLQFDMGASGANIGYMGAGSQLVTGSATADLGIRSASNLVVSTGGSTERLRVDTSGRLLIGKTSGDHKLDINGSNDEIRLSKSNLSDYTGIQLDRDASGTAGGYWGLAGATNHYINGAAQHDICVRSQSNLLFSTNGADERFRISASGHAVFGASSFGAAGSFGIEQDGNVRSVLAANSTGDTLFGAISGVSNGFQINISGSNDQLYRFHNGSQISMQIDSSGRVTKPLTPSFHAYNVAGNQSQVLTFSNTYHNIGNHFNASTGTFTCPVAGRYLFTFAFLHNTSPTSYARVLFQINGSRNTRYGDTLCDDTGQYINTSMCMIFNLSVNDTMQLYNEGNNIYSSQYGSFSGILLA